MKKIFQPKITLVGAGPGDVDLISVKGLKAIQNADVILYDALVNEELLQSAKANVKILYVGKRKGFKAFEQADINKMIVQFALLYGNVVRLKGGDSFVFGRGSEEIEFAQNLGITVEVIPGISSSIAVPALAGIPVTHRGVSNSFTVITGTLSDGSLNPEISNAPLLNGTVVILMGLSKIKEIASIYQLQGKEHTSVAVISNGSLPNQKTVVGNFTNINDKIVENQIKAPAVIIIGKVVNLLYRKDITYKKALELN